MRSSPRFAVTVPFALMALSACLCGCAWDGHFNILGYTTRPNYDEQIKTVRVTIFKNQTYTRGLEYELTQAVIREIQSKTPFRVVSEGCAADTELVGNIVSRNKLPVLYGPFNEVRDVEYTIGVELIWRDLRPGHVGEILSKPLTKPLPPPPVLPTLPGNEQLPMPTPVAPPLETPGAPSPVAVPGVVVLPLPPVLVQGLGTSIPELGRSTVAAQQEAINRLAVQIVSMMERPW
jgi:Lipopolysaccharide-assembly